MLAGPLVSVVIPVYNAERYIDDAMQSVLGQMTRPVLAGLVAGAALAAALAKVVLATPFGALISQIVHVTDPVAYLASIGLIVAVCLLAASIPAARAAKLDPMRTLRQT